MKRWTSEVLKWPGFSATIWTFAKLFRLGPRSSGKQSSSPWKPETKACLQAVPLGSNNREQEWGTGGQSEGRRKNQDKDMFSRWQPLLATCTRSHRDLGYSLWTMSQNWPPKGCKGKLLPFGSYPPKAKSSLVTVNLSHHYPISLCKIPTWVLSSPTSPPERSPKAGNERQGATASRQHQAPYSLCTCLAPISAAMISVGVGLTGCWLCLRGAG